LLRRQTRWQPPQQPQKLMLFFFHSNRNRNAALLASPLSIPSRQSLSSSNRAPPTPAAPRRAWVEARTASRSDNWQNCRSLDKAIIPVCSVYGPSGLV
jgi:hypothetical protein